MRDGGDDGHGAAWGRTAPAGAELGLPVLALLVLAVTGLLAACTTGPGPVTPPPPPPPPAACLLDTAAFAAGTGITWTPDASTASDTRCVYDPAGPAAGGADGPAFVAVDVAQAQDPAAELDRVGALCADGSRAPMATGGATGSPGGGEIGFVCRFQGGSVFGAAVRGDQLLTVSASAVPVGTTAAQLVLAFDQQLTAAAGR